MIFFRPFWYQRIYDTTLGSRDMELDDQNALYSLSSGVLALVSKNRGSLKSARIVATELCSLQILSLSDIKKYHLKDFTQTETYFLTNLFSPQFVGCHQSSQPVCFLPMAMTLHSAHCRSSRRFMQIEV